MLSRLAARAPAGLVVRATPALAGSARFFAHPRKINMIDSEFNPPSSEKPLYKNVFKQATPAEHAKDMENPVKAPAVHDTKDLMPSYAGDPHQTYGVAEWRHIHYEVTREPTFPRKPDLSKGELASGAQVVRTDVWADPNSKEPAITAIAKFSPENFRPVGWAENAPMPTTCCPEGTLDFRANRLPLEHADRRPFIYFCSAASGFIMTSLIRATVCKLVHTMWPAKDVFAAGIVEVDLRPIRTGQNFVVKWRAKPVFVRRRTPAMVEEAQRDDAIVASMRQPQTDGERVQRPEWLVVIGICTHLGCIPVPDQGNFGGYFCPCHGSHYDHSGRLRLGPAPANLEVPPHSFPNDITLKLG